MSNPNYNEVRLPNDIHRALIELMVLGGVADNQLKPVEMRLLGSIVAHLPIFSNFDLHFLSQIVDQAIERLKRRGVIEDLIKDICAEIPERLFETAYALAVDMVAADQSASEAELNYLQILRHIMGLDRLVCAAIERGARAHFINYEI